MPQLLEYFAVITVFMSVITFVAFYRDKRRAVKDRARTPEKTLHLLELLGGWPGALLGQRLLRHKSRKMSYRIVLGVITLLHISAWVYLALGAMASESAATNDKPLDQVSPLSPPDYTNGSSRPGAPSMTIETIEKTEDQWRSELTAEQFHVLRKHGTERAFTGDFWKSKDAGVYVCAACDLALYASDTKFDSGTGWPSFYEAVDEKHIGTSVDRKLFSVRTEVHCARCGGHLGHVFDDGPQPTGKRHCINSAALQFIPQAKNETIDP
jgi:peptide-methionine (R)-S-oxide reductase